MMRIAVAGGGGLGYLLASAISQADNAYNVVVLSRTARTEYSSFDIQVQTVDYWNRDSLDYALQGIDLVISTISGPEQINLIVAAGEGQVRHFVPAEFEGALGARSAQYPLLHDNLSQRAMELLEHLKDRKRMGYTVFSCGILMETFHPSGLGHFNMGANFHHGVTVPGDYLLNINTATAIYTNKNANGHRVHVCLTSAYDLAKFIVAALDIGPNNWPKEYKLRGERLSVDQLVSTCSQLRNVAFNHQIYPVNDLPAYYDYYMSIQDMGQAAYFQQLLATAHGRYDFRRPSLNEAIDASRQIDFTPMTFRQWLTRILYPTPQ